MIIDSIRIFYQDCLWTFEKIGIEHSFHRDLQSGVITIYKIDPLTGTSLDHLCMRNWDRLEFIYKEEDQK